MKNFSSLSRRSLIKTSIIGLAGISIPLYSRAARHIDIPSGRKIDVPDQYPSISDEIVEEVVGASHFNFNRVKELVDKRPELARATWDWGFGDFESALGAASHVGRRDIVQYLISKGARPNLFTFASLGAFEVVKNMIEFSPGLQRTEGPHGISLLRHAEAALRMEDDMSASEIDNAKKLIDYLVALGDAKGQEYLEMDEEAKKKYLGDYKYGLGDADGFSVKLETFGRLALGRLGAYGGALLRVDENKFIYNGAPSTSVTFQWEKGNVISLTVIEPGGSTVAKKM